MASIKNVIWSPSAQKDIENIADYLMYNWGNNVVEKFLKRIDNLILQIAANPKQYPIIHKTLKVRKCVVTKQNTLFYRMENDNIEIIRILAQDRIPKN